MTIRPAAAVLTLALLLASQAWAAAGRLVTVYPKAMPGIAHVLHVHAGVLRRGMEVDVYAGGVLLGTVSPFAIRGSREAGTYTVPLPENLARQRWLRVRLVLTQAGQADRAPTHREVRGVSVDVVPIR